MANPYLKSISSALNRTVVMADRFAANRLANAHAAGTIYYLLIAQD
jgi:hypothetical protein